MGADGRRAGCRIELYDRAKKKTLAADVISAKLLRIGLFWLLSAGRNAERQGDHECDNACLTLYECFHIPSHLREFHSEPFSVAGTKRKTVSRRKAKGSFA